MLRVENSVVAPLSAALLTRDQTLPVIEPLRPLLPAGGLVRGQLVGCRGHAARSLAVALAAAAVTEGAWIAALDVRGLGAEAARDLGLPLGRLVCINSDDDPRRWADAMAAALDGFELILTTPPATAGGGMWGRLQRRVAARRAVVVTVEPGRATPDVALAVSDVEWHHASDAHGHLWARRLVVQSSGRRVGAPRRVELWLPDAAGQLRTVVAAAPHQDDTRGGAGVAAAG